MRCMRRKAYVGAGKHPQAGSSCIKPVRLLRPTCCESSESRFRWHRGGAIGVAAFGTVFFGTLAVQSSSGLERTLAYREAIVSAQSCVIAALGIVFAITCFLPARLPKQAAGVEVRTRCPSPASTTHRNRRSQFDRHLNEYFGGGQTSWVAYQAAAANVVNTTLPKVEKLFETLHFFK